MIGWYFDPGTREHAGACFIDGKLAHVWFWPTATPQWDGRGRPDMLLIERPEVYPGPQPSRSDDIVRLAMLAAQLGAYLEACGAPTPRFARPREWKGQTPKPIHHRRIWSILEPPERDVFCAVAGKTETEIVTKIELACAEYGRSHKIKRYSWKAHNLLDAVGLGLWDLKRMGAGVRR
jgi:ribosomal protein L37E